MVAKQSSAVSSGGIKVLDQQVVKTKKEGANDLGEEDYEYDEESYYEEEAQPHNQKTDENLIGGGEA